MAPLFLATGVFRAATDVAAAPQRGANPSFATEAGSGEAASLLCNSERGAGGFGILTGHFGSESVVALASSLLDKGGARRTQSRARSSFAEPQPTLAKTPPLFLQRYKKKLELTNYKYKTFKKLFVRASNLLCIK